jgi:hypothetical protein
MDIDKEEELDAELRVIDESTMCSGLLPSVYLWLPEVSS